MADTPDPSAHPELVEGPTLALPDFTPVPRLQKRRDGWAPAVQRAFIDALADIGSVEAACRLVDRSPASAYRLRRHPEGAEFAQAWQAAIDFGIKRIEDYAMDRAVNGTEVPVFAYGDRIATRRVYNDTLVMFMLRNRAAGRYCADGPKALNAVDTHVLQRLKKEWRAQWEREQGILACEQELRDEDDLDHTLDEICDKLELAAQRERALWSPRTRELHEAWERSKEDDKASGYAWMGEARRAREAEEAAAEEEALALPPPSEEAQEEDEAGPRVRTLKDDEW